jgi:hypothetical protein
MHARLPADSCTKGLFDARYARNKFYLLNMKKVILLIFPFALSLAPQRNSIPGRRDREAGKRKNRKAR